ncbi:Lcl C-terminal domain-containing protein [Marinicella gelatinilytica]|uniref:Lcl C-terminal domain-containing protein n=1 Tax=Marinicella gelatinilytica TaxID=2996017 RepID=UPI002260A30A|nr:DUF1566 domain-containing protein [Marinicella gelatinilytica]MCX7546292.1 DUF1566 domain-containing protein [Marinicella gelatinilytica]
MKKINLIFVCVLTVQITHAQTCSSVSEIHPSTPNGIFNDYGDGTVSDNSTGLMWQKCQLGLSGSDCLTGSVTSHNWEEALNMANNSTLAEYNDWRLPNHKELLSIVEQRCYSPSINTTYFPNTSSSYFWSISPSVSYSESSWVVNFDHGGSFNSNGRDGRFSNFFVRLVRSE